MSKLTKNPFFYLSIVLVLVLVFQVASFVRAAFQEPSAAFPAGAPSAPLDTSDLRQTKFGKLFIDVSAETNKEALELLGGGTFCLPTTPSSGSILCKGAWNQIGQWTLSGSDIYYNSGNVGIGTASPQDDLDMNSGTIRFYSGTDYQRIYANTWGLNLFTNKLADSGLRIGEIWGGLGLYSADGSTSYDLTLGVPSGKQVNIGHVDNFMVVKGNGDVSWTGSLTGGSVPWTRVTGEPTFITADSIETLTNKSGNISQWTNDSVYITDGNTDWDNIYSLITANVSGQSFWWSNSLLVHDQGGAIELGGTNGVAGIGTPYIDFHYDGIAEDYNVRIVNDADGQLTLTAGNVRVTGELKVASHIRVEDATLWAGTVWINNITTFGSNPLCWDGDGGSSIFACASSIEFKENVKDLSFGLDTVIDLQPREFDWKSRYTEEEGTIPGLHDLGLIAEEVELVEPLLVSYSEEGKPTSVKYRHMTALLIKAIQEQQKQIEEQKQLIEGLRGEFEGLK